MPGRPGRFLCRRKEFIRRPQRSHREGAINKTVILTRPFAQLNIGATDHSEELSMRSYCSYFQYLYSNLNLYTEEVSGEAKIIYAVGFTEITEPFPVTVEGADIKYLAMYYLPASTEESSVHIGFYMLNDVNDYNTPNMISFITDVPLRRNYRTNLYGPLFSNVLPRGFFRCSRRPGCNNSF